MCRSALFCSQPDKLPNQEAGQKIPWAQRERKHRHMELGTWITTLQNGALSLHNKEASVSRQEKQFSTFGGRYEEFRKQNKALLLGKLYTAVFCQ